MSAVKTWSPRAIGNVVLGLRWHDIVGAAARRLPAFLAGRSADRTRIEACADAAAVRELAYHHLQSDPGFAADLFAAADRHEAALLGALRGAPVNESRRPTRDPSPRFGPI